MPDTRWSYLIDVMTRTIKMMLELMWYFYKEYEDHKIIKDKKLSKL